MRNSKKANLLIKFLEKEFKLDNSNYNSTISLIKLIIIKERLRFLLQLVKEKKINNNKMKLEFNG